MAVPEISDPVVSWDARTGEHVQVRRAEVVAVLPYVGWRLGLPECRTSVRNQRRKERRGRDDQDDDERPDGVGDRSQSAVLDGKT
ncbi:hypothetical protein [Amycolatopsis sp. EV170708-02-1]|uniref:hypothetical protein n=1 Tax=Amycolatopsis sp. EV170708-02-1 TaxID=2919322 RepID=UPI001F0B8F60|nr:hypothetical protein [Amycolatopsis sp. EV170708-02-1]UMP07233.1 hypothetical protein MJQ72_21550 [Amycolatopsis sp. EV170708-02-1]